MKSIAAAFAASLALVAGLFVGATTGPANAVVRDDGAHHARHTARDDGPRANLVAKAKRVGKAKRDDGAHHARHTRRDDGPRHNRRDDHPHRHSPRHG